MPAVLVTLADAKIHLRVTTSAHDVDIQTKLDEAESTIRDYLKTGDDPTWTEATVPPLIKAAIKIVLADLYRHRGDDQDATEKLWVQLDLMLRRYVPHALA